MHVAGVHQFAEHERRAACGLEAVHVGFAVRVDACQQRHGLRDQIHVVPGQHDAGRTRHCDPVDGVVGRTAGRHQRDHGIDDGPFVDQTTERAEVIAQRGDRQCACGAFAGQCIAQRQLRIDERGAGQLHAHRFEQHLVGVRRAVKGAGAGRVIRRGFGLQQFGAGGFASGVAFADFGFLLVRDARGHRTSRHEDRRQMAKRQRTDQQTRHDLVAHPQVHHAVEHVMAQANGRSLSDVVAREQRQLHAGAALGHAVTHRRHAAGHLRSGAK